MAAQVPAWQCARVRKQGVHAILRSGGIEDELGFPVLLGNRIVMIDNYGAVRTVVSGNSDLEYRVIRAEDQQCGSNEDEQAGKKNPTEPFPERREWVGCHEVQIISPKGASDAR